MFRGIRWTRQSRGVFRYALGFFSNHRKVTQINRWIEDILLQELFVMQLVYIYSDPYSPGPKCSLGTLSFYQTIFNPLNQIYVQLYLYLWRFLSFTVTYTYVQEGDGFNGKPGTIRIKYRTSIQYTRTYR